MGIGYVLSEMKLIQVSIPSNGSIQFLREIKMDIIDKIKRGLNPLKRVNSILTLMVNSFSAHMNSLNPLKRVNSILTYKLHRPLYFPRGHCLNPLKRVNSILTILHYYSPQMMELMSQSPQTGQFNSYLL